MVTDLVIAIAILMIAAMPLGVSIVRDQNAVRTEYHRAVAMEIVDGEMEILAAGEWRAFGEGAHEYRVRAEAAKNLPAGRFQLTRGAKSVRLEWVPAKRGKGGPVAREFSLEGRR
ncbi:MAG: hypothetical protein AB1705_09440 [Verrucomicrobiota bacterium]